MTDITRKVIDHTCDKVYRLIDGLPFETYLANVRGCEDSDAICELADLAKEAGKIAQDNGATEIRIALGRMVDDLSSELDDAYKEIDYLQDKVQSLEYRIASLESDVQRLQEQQA